ncbi:MAG: response regulator [Gammaproteobacteria bacterium SHHR-1]|uniref:response regulator n=1 Tax=Magnetovirga frankeli TaxID=947516 RepID=UPI001AF82E74|nr:response regulator [gamma proteobacterium SS-5]
MSPASNPRAQLLVVDDQHENLHLLIEILRDEFSLLAATSGSQALQLAHALPRPDLILLDIKMPEMDGYAVLAQLRASAETRDIPVIFVTALADLADEARGFQLGVSDYIGKPVNPLLLKQRIRTQLELRRYRQDPPRPASAEPQGTVPPLLLLVDDQPENLHLLIEQLKQDYRLLVARNGAEALAQLEAGLDTGQAPDLVLLDVLMPEMDGFAVCRRIKAGPWAHIPVIFISVVEATEDKVKSFAAGAADYVTKPFEIDEVRARIRTHLELSRLRLQLQRQVDRRTQMLEQSSARFQQLFEDSPVAMVLMSPEGVNLAQNRRFERLFGYPQGEISHLDDWWRLAYPDPDYRAEVQACWQEQIGQAALHEGELSGGEFRVACRDGQARLIRMSAMILNDGVLTSFIDVTEQRAAEAEIRQLNAHLEQRVAERTAELQAINRELDSFAYAISHDLRAPLRAISGFATQLQEKHAGQLPPSGQDLLTRIGQAGTRMGQLIEALLQLSRHSRGPLHPRLLDLSALAREQLAELAEQQPQRQVELQIQPGLQVWADPQLFGSVLANLLDNAWKYSARNPQARIRIYLRAEADDEHWICIEDNGVGFDMDQADDLYQPFQRLHPRDEFPGIGIGLATVRRIIQRHGGHLQAWSQPGQGSRFCFQLPPRPTDEG